MVSPRLFYIAELSNQKNPRSKATSGPLDQGLPCLIDAD